MPRSAIPFPANRLLLLPNLSRDAQTFSVLQPGVNPSGFAAGSANDQNTYQLDGGNITDDLAGTTVTYQTSYAGLGGSQGGSIAVGVIPTPVESIEEFKVSISNQTSDFNNSSGMQVQLVTKRGYQPISRLVCTCFISIRRSALPTRGPITTRRSALAASRCRIRRSFPTTATVSAARLAARSASKEFLGGKWYFFFNYEGLRFPNAGLYTGKKRPFAADAGGRDSGSQLRPAPIFPYNLNPWPGDGSGRHLSPAVCPAGSCDPRGLGLNPIVSKIWNTQMPLPNNPLGGDEYNTQGFLATIRSPQTSDTLCGPHRSRFQR